MVKGTVIDDLSSPVESFLKHAMAFFDSSLGWLHGYTPSIMDKVPLGPMELQGYAIYNGEHYNNPTKDYYQADLWYDKAFIGMLVLGYFVLMELVGR